MDENGLKTPDFVFEFKSVELAVPLSSLLEVTSKSGRAQWGM